MLCCAGLGCDSYHLFLHEIFLFLGTNGMILRLAHDCIGWLQVKSFVEAAAVRAKARVEALAAALKQKSVTIEVWRATSAATSAALH